MAKELPQSMRDHLIVALDLPQSQALPLVDSLLPEGVSIFKVGWPLILDAGGFGIIEKLEKKKAKVFLDLKPFDITETITRYLNEVETKYSNVVYATIHVFNRGLEEALRLREESRKFKVLVVTHLTSMDVRDLRDMGIKDMNVLDYVLNQTRKAVKAGCDGVIASGLEVAGLRAEFDGKITIVTPAIRPVWAEVPNDDQKRIATPRQAILDGADFLVVGRPIYQNPPGGNPVEAVRRIQAEIAGALTDRASGSESGGDRPSMRVAAG